MDEKDADMESEAEEDTMIEFGMVTLSIIRYILSGT